MLLENKGAAANKVNFEFKGDFSTKKLAGHSTSPTLVNWDNKGNIDLLLGAEDGYFYYWKNE